jgi:hypothetical protein
VLVPRNSKLPRPITIPQVMTLKTLADVRKLLVKDTAAAD